MWIELLSLNRGRFYQKLGKLYNLLPDYILNTDGCGYTFFVLVLALLSL